MLSWLEHPLVSPLVTFPWHFSSIALCFLLLGAALYGIFAHRKQLKWQQETAERLEDAIQTRTFELQATLAELADKNRALEEQNTLDALTGIRNRAFFDKKLIAELKRSRREQRPLALVMLDIDHFKNINDQYGHVAGDAIIRGVAHRIASLLKRASDHVCRYGGEEFALILPNTDAEGVQVLAEHIRHEIARAPFSTEIGELPVHISAGCVALIPTGGTTPIEMIQAADQALYQAKHQGRNQVSIFNQPSDASASSGELRDELSQ